MQLFEDTSEQPNSTVAAPLATPIVTPICPQIDPFILQEKKPQRISSKGFSLAFLIIDHISFKEESMIKEDLAEDFNYEKLHHAMSI